MPELPRPVQILLAIYSRVGFDPALLGPEKELPTIGPTCKADWTFPSWEQPNYLLILKQRFLPLYHEVSSDLLFFLCALREIIFLST